MSNFEISGNIVDECMFYSDDKHPDDLVMGHIDHLVKIPFALHR